MISTPSSRHRGGRAPPVRGVVGDGAPDVGLGHGSRAWGSTARPWPALFHLAYAPRAGPAAASARRAAHGLGDRRMLRELLRAVEDRAARLHQLGVGREPARHDQARAAFCSLHVKARACARSRSRVSRRVCMDPMTMRFGNTMKPRSRGWKRIGEHPAGSARLPALAQHACCSHAPPAPARCGKRGKHREPTWCRAADDTPFR